MEQLSEAGLGGEVCSVIGECVSVRSEELRSQLLRDSAKVSPSSLTDFDWKLKVSRNTTSSTIADHMTFNQLYD